VFPVWFEGEGELRSCSCGVFRNLIEISRKA
jgi:hypothetical protein